MGAAGRPDLKNVGHAGHSGSSNHRKGEADITHEQKSNLMAEAVQMVQEDGLEGLARSYPFC